MREREKELNTKDLSLKKGIFRNKDEGNKFKSRAAPQRPKKNMHGQPG